MPCYAHTATKPDGTPDPDESKWQRLDVHLRNVAELANKFAAPFGASAEAHLAGLLHDLGKYRDEFQSYLRGERSSSSETQHAIFGAAWAADESRPQLFASKLAIAGHHAGLHNQCDIEGMCAKHGLHIPDTVPALIAQLESELGPLSPLPTPPPWIRDTHSAEFYARLIFSCIVDADRLDTAHWPDSPSADALVDCDTLLAAVHAERANKTAANPVSPLTSLRNRIFDTALEGATLPTGFFSLTVPTGGGKTLASMAFALAHARAHGLRRIIVVIPYHPIRPPSSTAPPSKVSSRLGCLCIAPLLGAGRGLKLADVENPVGISGHPAPRSRVRIETLLGERNFMSKTGHPAPRSAALLKHVVATGGRCFRISIGGRRPPSPAPPASRRSKPPGN